MLKLMLNEIRSAQRRWRVNIPCSTKTATTTLALLIAAALVGCAVGPDYQRPSMDLPDHFKEGVEWQRAQVDTAAALRDDWWRNYHDQVLDQTVDQAIKANQSIVAAEAAYRVAQAVLHSAQAAQYPSLNASLSGSRTGVGSNVPLAANGSGKDATYNLVALGAQASWEPDLWGGVRRNVEAAKASGQASDAQLAGVRLSIVSNVASTYFALRQADIDIASFQSQRDLQQRLLHMVESAHREGMASNDDVLAARQTLDAVITTMESTQTLREQTEHALAVLLGLPPAAYTLAPQPDYGFSVPPIPPVLPSQLLLRRYDVVNAERIAAAANAKIGVAKAAYFPALTLSAQGGFDSTSLSQLLAASSHVWTLGPSLAVSLFDGGARDAAVESARATYDGQVAMYRYTVISALQSVEDSLSSMQHLNTQVAAQARILRDGEQLYASASLQRQIGASSEQDQLNAKLALLQAQRNAVGARAALAQSSVVLIENLGGGWQWNPDEKSSSPSTQPLPQSGSSQ